MSLPSSRRTEIQGNSPTRWLDSVDVSTGMIALERPRPTKFQSPTGSPVFLKYGKGSVWDRVVLAQARNCLRDAGPSVQVKGRRRRRLRYGMACLASSEAGTPPPRTPPPLPPPRSQLLCPSSPLPLFPQHNIHDYRRGHRLRSAGLFGFVSTDGRLDGGR